MDASGRRLSGPLKCMDLESSLPVRKNLVSLNNPNLSFVELTRHQGLLIGDSLITYGGRTTKRLNSSSLFKFDMISKKFRKLKAYDVPEIDSHRMLNDNDDLIVFGGYIENSGFSNHLFKIYFDKKKNAYFKSLDIPGKKPEPRSNCSFVMIRNNSYAVYGGGNNDRRFNDLWVYQNNERTIKVEEVVSKHPTQERSEENLHEEDAPVFWIQVEIQSGILEVNQARLDPHLYLSFTNFFSRLRTTPPSLQPIIIC